MRLLLAFLLLAVVTGIWSRRRGQTNRVWPLLAVTLVVAIGYLSRRMI